MWFPTATKLDAALKLLLERLGTVQLGIEQVIQSDGILDSVFGPSEEYSRFLIGGEKLMEALLNVLVGLRAGRVTVREVNLRMSNANLMVQRHEDMFRMMMAGRKAGAAAVDRFFGN